jgi:adenosylhomocysteine nucleosidase
MRELTGEAWGEPLALVDRDAPTLATGDAFVSDPVIQARLAGRAPLVDMEAYALAAAANQAGVPIRVVKHVSDDASKGVGRTWRETTAESARALADLDCENTR